MNVHVYEWLAVLIEIDDTDESRDFRFVSHINGRKARVAKGTQKAKKASVSFWLFIISAGRDDHPGSYLNILK